MKIISNCSICKEHSLHVIESEQTTLMQCLYCGYATSEKFYGTKEENEEFKRLSPDFQKWSKYDNNRIWIPGVLTLPEGMVSAVDVPTEKGSVMRWAYSEMKEIPEDEQHKYPGPDGTNFTQMYDNENPKIFENFYDCLKELNEKAKGSREQQISKLKLPKLKRVK